MKSMMTVLMMSILLSACGRSSSTTEALTEKVGTDAYKISRDPLERDKFDLPVPKKSDLKDELILWATHYYLPVLKDGSGTFPLRDMNGAELGPRLTLREWCDSAMEGSVRINYVDGATKTYNYAGVMDYENVDCSSIFRINVSKTKFREAIGPYGDGINDYILVPYRTIATDNTQIAPGTVLYVPEARGAIIKLASGRIIAHDGYFFAGDKGGAIKGNHIDVFIGTSKSSEFFPWIKSNAEKTFKAIVVKDRKIEAKLEGLHLQ